MWKIDLKEHIHAVHESPNDYKCESCGKSFPDAEANDFTKFTFAIFVAFMNCMDVIFRTAMLKLLCLHEHSMWVVIKMLWHSND